jgi:hypothetical protein
VNVIFLLPVLLDELQAYPIFPVVLERFSQTCMALPANRPVQSAAKMR